MNDCPEGIGTLITVFKDSSISHYEGNYGNNVRNGHGTHHWKNEKKTKLQMEKIRCDKCYKKVKKTSCALR